MPKVHEKPINKNDLKLFKLVNGQHIGIDYTAEPEVVTDKDGNVTGYIYPSKVYNANTADCYVLHLGDLVRLCVNKFQAEPDWSDAYRRVKISPHNPPLDQPDVSKPAEEKKTQPKPKTHESKELPSNLNSMTVHELEDYAKSEEIDLKGAKTKNEMIRAIRSSV